MSFFNNREISIICWGVTILGLALTKKGFRNSINDIIILFFNPKILVPYLLAVIYTLLGVAMFDSIGIWTNAQAKDTLIWCVLTVISTIFELNSIKSEKTYFKKAVRNNFKLSLVMEFVTGVYTFNLIGELFLVPIAVIIGGMQAVAEHDSKYKMVVTFLRNLLFVFGLFLIGYTIYEIRLHIKEFASFDTLRDFLLAPALSLWFIPFMYCLWLYMKYEAYLVSMSSAIKDKKLLRYAKLQALLRFNTDIQGLERWKNRLFIGSTNNKKEILFSIKEIKRLQKIEKNPPVVNTDLGWSPYQAKDFLVPYDLATGYYANSYEDEWHAISRYKILEEDLLSNNIAYYVYGTETVVTKLQLVLNINNPKSASTAIEILVDMAQILYYHATGKILSEKIKQSILQQKPITKHIDGKTIKSEIQVWENDKKKSTMFFVIEHAALALAEE